MVVAFAIKQVMLQNDASLASSCAVIEVADEVNHSSRDRSTSSGSGFPARGALSLAEESHKEWLDLAKICEKSA